MRSVLFFLLLCYPTISTARPLIFDHDGNNDDILSLFMLLSEKNVDLQGVMITPADCRLPEAVEITTKVLSLSKKFHVPVVVGQTPARHNPFPDLWRDLTKNILRVADIFLHNSKHQGPEKTEAGEWLRQYLIKQPEQTKTDFVIVGPATNLVNALTRAEHLTKKIGKVFWMGGAVHAPGNVVAKGHNGSAEWNAYWDPSATQKLFELGLDIWLVPLDVTNKVKVTKEFVRFFNGSGAVTTESVRQIWAQSFFQDETYYMWDTLTTGLFFQPNLAVWEELSIKAISTGVEQGLTLQDLQGDHKIHVAKDVRVQDFHKYVVHLLGGSIR